MNTSIRSILISLTVVAANTIPTLASAQLSRPTRVAQTDCRTQNHPRRYPHGDQVLNRLMGQLISANSSTFQGDLAPSLICIRATAQNTLIAQAHVAERSITVHPDMFDRVRNDSQLAWVIAHELAHITMRHSTDGQPLSGPEGELVQSKRVRMQELEVAGALQAKGTSPARDEYDRLNREVQEILARRLGREAAANWEESEADQVALQFYVRAGFDPAEIGWRQEQVAIARAANQDVNGPPTETSSAARSRQAAQTCNVTGPSSPEPTRGLARYASDCWSVWNLKYDQFSRNPELARLRGDTQRRVITAFSDDTRRAQEEARRLGECSVCGRTSVASSSPSGSENAPSSK